MSIAKLAQCTRPILSKGQTLQSLHNSIAGAQVLPVYLLRFSEFKNTSNEAMQKIFQKLQTNNLIVRSSYSGEDSGLQSLAGMFLSVANNCDVSGLRDGISQVFASYPEGFADTEEVLIQPMLANVKHCGVIFTRDQTTGAPYYQITDDITGSTDIVTSGAKGNTRYYCVRHGQTSPSLLAQKLVNLSNYLIEHFDSDLLDIEYAIDAEGILYLLQVRPLICQVTQVSPPESFDHIERKIATLFQAHPYLYGKTSMLGVMPDWNPAEIIGLYPKPLALSLYKELITDSIWAYQRNNYGYKNLRSFPLLVDLQGIPFIDVRVSFNSFLPKDISDPLGHKLLGYYLGQLEANPKSHDSVEFDIVLSCYTPAVNARLKTLQEHGFDAAECQELKTHLLHLTNKIIDPRTGLWIQDLHRIETLKQRHQEVMEKITDPVSKIYWLLEDCKRYGTLPFAGLARAAFIAIQMLRSFVETRIITQAEYDGFLRSLNTVSGDMQQGLSDLSQSEFLAKYGHLRPGTYDICSPRYDAKPELYFDWQSASSQNTLGEPQEKNSPASFTFDKDVMNKINAMLKEHGINHTADSLMHFIKCAVEGREYAKFVFTRSLSAALEVIGELGEQYSYTRAEMAFVDITAIYQLMTSGKDIKSLLAQQLATGRANYAKTLLVKMPPLITHPKDIYAFENQDVQANFVTQKRVVGQSTGTDSLDQLQDKIVFIKSADPGYDWLFSHPIKGFVTAYGGTNSHMAIRAAELDIPAVIGAGEYNFERWQQAHTLELDCQTQSVRIIS